MELSFWDLPATARASKASHVLAVGYAHADADPYLDAIESAGLRVRAADAQASALASAAVPLAGATGTFAVVDVGWTGATLAVVRDGVVTYERFTPDIGIAKLAAALRNRLAGDEAVVEYLLRDVGLGPAGGTAGGADAAAQADMHDLIVAHVEPLTEELRQSLAYHEHQYPAAAGRAARGVGGRRPCRGSRRTSATALGVEWSAAAPDRVAACPPALQRRASPLLATAMGLAMFPG